MGVRDFDVARHQPHPPGYPAFIALGKVGTAALASMGVPAADVRGLAIWSALGAAALTILLFFFFKLLEPESEWRAAVATVLATCCPLVWFNAARPMSDMAGLAVAFGALAALLGTRTLLFGAFLAGLAVGFRSQMVFLTAPMLVFALVASRRRPHVLIAAGLGIAVWAIPNVLLNGGPAGYLRALGSQAGEDFTGVVMLWTNPTPRVAVEAVLYTFARPWDWPVLGGVMLALASAGALVLWFRSRRTLYLLLLAFGPYAAFHLLFQEPLTTRYALPLMPLMTYLAAVVLTEARGGAAAIGTAALVAASLMFAVPATAAFGREPSPVFAMLSEIRLLQQRGANPTVAMHRRVFTETRRPRAYAGDVPGKILPTPRDYEWLELTRAWRAGVDGETWFLADPRRTDLALIDRAHTRTREYRWPFTSSIYVGGVRPNEIDWHIFNAPGWFLEEGWALTPETAGIADRDGWGPHRRPSIGWLRRRSTESLMMIGGRHLAGDPPVSLNVSIDDRPVATLTIRPGFFLQFLKVPAAALDGQGTYAKLTVSATAPSTPVPPIAVEQFNFQPADRIQFGFDEGWFEPEYNPATAKTWRWMTDHAVVSVRNAGRPVTLRLTGESPLHYFDDAPAVRVGVGDRTLSEIRPTADFTTEVAIPADLLAASGGRVVISSDRTFVAGEREGTQDRRKLALRVFSVTVE